MSICRDSFEDRTTSKISMKSGREECVYGLSNFEKFLPVGKLAVEKTETARNDGVTEESKANTEGDTLHEHVRADEQGDEEKWSYESSESDSILLLGKRGGWRKSTRFRQYTVQLSI